MHPSARIALVAAFATLWGASPAVAQDVELLSEIHGTPLPDGYFRTLAGNSRAFEFSRGRAVRLRERMAGGAGAPGAGPGAFAPMAILGPRDGPVTGTMAIPMLLGLFSDSPPGVPPFPREQVSTAYFGPGWGTITHYYQEVSGGRVTLTGEVHDWVRSGVSQAAATGGESGLVSGTAGDFIMDLLTRMPQAMDWGLYDNDGPDGVPNSGDDDGFVDVLSVIHPTRGAECGGTGKADRIWSHRWSLHSAVGRTFVTATPSANGGYVEVDDYVIQPVYACDGTDLNQIGVFTHELGHAFGLPDLYDTDEDDGKHQGAGNWALMATGSYGCDGDSSGLPCHMSAWSKMVLGWVDVETLPLDTDLRTLTLPPVETTGKVYRVESADDSGEFYLLENRQRVGYDARLLEEGLLIWRVSRAILADRWRANRVNAHDPLGVLLQEADGLNDLVRPGCGRGNAGDPFPFVGPMTGRCGTAEGENHVFHTASDPSSVSYAGNPSGLTLVDIQRVGDNVTFRATTRFTRIAVRSEGDAGSGGLFTVDGTRVGGIDHDLVSAPFVSHTVEAAVGEPLGEGVRRPFVGWADDAGVPRVRTVETPLEDLDLVARYQGQQYGLLVDMRGGQGDVTPGTLATDPTVDDPWFAPGTAVTVEAVPRQGFSFLGWTGALEGRPNPTTVTLDSPVSAGADFELIYAVPATTVTVSAAEDPQLTLEPEHGTPPYAWSVLDGTLPAGLFLTVGGQLSGAALDTGDFPLTVRVHDGLGLMAEGSFTVQVEDPALPVAALASRFLLSGPQLSAPQATFLDRKGNGDGTYDIGDFRAWVLAHPELPLTASMRALVAPRVLKIPMARPGGTVRGPEVRR